MRECLINFTLLSVGFLIPTVAMLIGLVYFVECTTPQIGCSRDSLHTNPVLQIDPWMPIIVLIAVLVIGLWYDGFPSVDGKRIGDVS